MSVYHSPRCQIAWTNVVSDGVDRDVVVRDKPLSLFFGLNFDNNIRTEAGWFYLYFRLLRAGQSSQFYQGIWSGWIPMDFPSSGGSIWVLMSWTQATDLTNGNLGLFLYQPTVRFNILTPGASPWWTPTGDDEFAVAEEDHYVLFE